MDLELRDTPKPSIKDIRANMKHVACLLWSLSMDLDSLDNDMQQILAENENVEKIIEGYRVYAQRLENNNRLRAKRQNKRSRERSPGCPLGGSGERPALSLTDSPTKDF